MPNNNKSLYFHIDNGGYNFSIEDTCQLVIDFSFFGYSDTTIRLNNLNSDSYRKLSEFFLLQALEMKKVEKNFIA
jgi:hypothetical protein